MTAPDETRTDALLPWQAKVARLVLESAPGSAFQVIAPGAAGKSTLARAIVGRTVRRKAEARVLVTCPAALADAWRHQLDGLTFDPPRVLDLATILEADERGTWPAGTIQIVPVDVAKRPGIARRVMERDWDLLLSEVVPPVTPRRRELMEAAQDSGRFERILVLGIQGIPSDRFVACEVTREDVVDSEGRPLLGPPPERSPLPFRRSATECGRLNDLQGLADRIVDRVGLPALFRDVTLAAAHSSPPAREETLRGILAGGRALRTRTGLAGRDTHWSLHQAFPHTWDLVEPEEDRRPLPAITVAELDEMLSVADRLLAETEDSPEEPKLEATVAALMETLAKAPETRIALTSAFRSTALYLESVGPDLPVELRAVRPGQSLGERLACLAMHREAGGMLVLPDAAAQDLALEYVDEVVAFDLPLSGAEADRRLARFDRPGRTSRLRVRFLADETEGLSWRPAWPGEETA